MQSSMPTPSPSQQRLQSYRALGVSANDVAEFPRLALSIKSAGGKLKALEYIRSSADPAARRFISVYDNILLPVAVRRILPIEAFCVAARVTADDFRSVLARSIRTIHQFESAVKAAEAHPAIVNKSTELAQEGDFHHATLNMKHMGFLPAPANSRVEVNVSAHAQAASQVQSAIVSAPSPENTIRRLVNRFNTEPKQLTEAKEVVPLVMPRSAAEPMEAEYEDSEEEDADDVQESSAH